MRDGTPACPIASSTWPSISFDAEKAGCCARSISVHVSVSRSAATAILITSAPVDRIASARSARSAGTPVECVHARARCRVPAAGATIAGTNSARASTSMYSAPGSLRVGEQPLALLFRPTEPASLPGRAARDDHRTAAALDRPDRVGRVDRVEAQFHQVGVGGGVTCAAQLLHRPSGHRHAHLRLAHGHQKEKASSAGAEEASWNP